MLCLPIPFMGRSFESAVCRECLPDRVSQGVFGSGERCVIPCSVGQRPLGVDTCTECTAVPGTYANTSVERDPADPSTWAAPGCASCPSGKRADGATGAVCLPCFPGQFASSTGSVSCPICLGRCPDGKFSDATGLSDASQCTPCPPGRHSSPLTQTQTLP